MISYQEIAIRLLLAALLGSVVGLDRERLERGAGLRTHMLVAVGSAVFMLVSAYGFADVLGHQNVVLDPSRVAAQVVSGIGFLGAGTIILRKEIVHGLTTAASLWAVAAIGLATGGGLYLAAVAATFVVLFILLAVKPLERHLFLNRRPRTLTLTIERTEFTLSSLESAIESADLHMQSIVFQPGDEQTEIVQLTVDRVTPDKVAALIDSLRDTQGVKEIRRDS
ncbi:MAG: MgtC/SapB family protein [Pyrinomonadaceae bacterium]|nr:MgtC/SapB family protein [Pyrinomonadaceae bacterium]